MQLTPPQPQAGSMPQSLHPAALAASGVIAAGKVALFRISILNTNAAARYLQLFNSATVPADAVVPVMSIPVSIGGFVSVDFGVYGKLFPTGLAWCTSSTAATKTIGAADALVEATYKANA